MSKSFYPQLALQNCVKNGKFYFPYLLTVLCTAAAFYICEALSESPWAIEGEAVRYDYLTMFMTIGVVILGGFSVIFLLYTNSFLMKRRARELGLYNVLGMGKGHIALVLSYESLYTWILGAGGGILVGMLLQRLMIMLARRLMRVDPLVRFSIVPKAILTTAAFFGFCLLLTLLGNFWRLGRQNPVELLRGSQMGERQPKTRFFIALLGLCTLGGGYGIAVTVKNPIDALAQYFLAVGLVMIGTYCLFSALSILVLKLLRFSRNYYYKTPHFIGVSGMIHRMNRNAVGLANICILSTMVMVMISGTLSLYLGTEDSLHTRYPAQLNFRGRYRLTQNFDLEEVEKIFRERVEEQGAEVTGSIAYQLTAMEMRQSGSTLRCQAKDQEGPPSLSDLPLTTVFLTAEGYRSLTGETLDLGRGELASTAAFPDGAVSFVFGDGEESGRLDYRQTKLLPGDFYLPDYGVMAMRTAYVVLPDMDALEELLNQWNAAGRNANWREGSVKWYLGLDTGADVQEQQQIEKALFGPAGPEEMTDSSGERIEWDAMLLELREGMNTEEYYSINGGFFFLGIFLGLIFIMAMALIMYYKQISEGYEDRERFKIMQQVGLTKREIRRSINSQVLLVFFAPLAVAGVHLAFDFGLVKLLLTLFSVYNSRLAAWCSLATFGVFTLLYLAVYLATARTYYKIVSE